MYHLAVVAYVPEQMWRGSGRQYRNLKLCNNIGSEVGSDVRLSGWRIAV